MKIYRLTIEPLSAFGSPLQSDTIFGHLMWALYYTARQDGDKNLQTFLNRYRAGSPPLLVSAGFPEGRLPLPILETPLPELEEKGANRLVDHLIHRKMRERRYLSLSYWQTLAQNLSSEVLQKVLKSAWIFAQEAQNQSALPPFQTGAQTPSVDGPLYDDYQKGQMAHAVSRSSINRLTGRTKTGPFINQETVYSPQYRFDIWHKLADEDLLPQVRAWWQWIERNGFGRRKSAGAGAFRIVRPLEVADDLWPTVENPNGFVSLSAWVPTPDDPSKVSYRPRIKRGKLGEQFALPTPWKKPLLMLEPGAVAQLPVGDKLKPYYGQLVENMHETKAGIVQYAYALPLPVHIQAVTK